MKLIKHKIKTNNLSLRCVIAINCFFLAMLGGCGGLDSSDHNTNTNNNLTSNVFGGDILKKEFPIRAEGIEEGNGAEIYQPFCDINYYSSPDKSEKPIGYFSAGEKIYIDSTTNYGTELWGKSSEDCWVLISNQQYIFLPRAEDLNFQETDVNKDFVSEQSGFIDCYLVPILDTEPASVINISKGNVVYVQTTVTDNKGNVFGKLDKNKWITISRDGKTYFSNSPVEQEDNSIKNDNQDGQIVQITPSSSDYIFPYSDSSYLSASDLNGFSQTDANLARNEIYARHGRMFDTAFIRDYFLSKSWYNPCIKPSEFNEAVFNEFEKANIQTIVEYEKQMGWR